MHFPGLAEPLTLRGVTIRNRIASSGHDTMLIENGLVTEDLVAYQEARAAGGVGLIVVQVAGVHESARYTSALMATDDAVIPGYRTLVDAVHAKGAAVFGQLFHPGREISETSDGTAPIALAPSAVPSERFVTMPRALTGAQIEQILGGYAAAARRLQLAGGNFDNRLRFVTDALSRVCEAVGPDFVIGIRISGEKKSHDGLHLDLVVDICRALDEAELVDYVSVCAGSSSTLSGALHIAAPMTETAGERLQQYVRTTMIRQPLAARVTILANNRLVGIDADTAYLQNTLSEEPIPVEDVAAVVLAHGNLPARELDLDALEDLGVATYEAGDCVTARTVEEAILDGLVIGTRI